MFDYGKNLDEVNEYIAILLSILEKKIYVANKQGYNDINKLSENFLCGLFNIVYDLNLINANSIRITYPVIDLIDSTNKVCFQITSDNRISKIENCLDMFNKKKLYEEYDKLFIVILGKKSSHRKYPNYDRVNYKIIDFGDIIRTISNLNNTKLEMILHYFEDNFGKNTLKKVSELALDKELFKEETILRSKPFNYYTFGLGKVRVDVFIPSIEDRNISACFTFAQDNISGCSITLNEEQLNNLFFVDYGKESLNECRFFVNINRRRKNVIVDFPSNRFSIDLETAKQMKKIVDSLYEKYIKEKKKIILTLGAEKFECSKSGEYKILRVPLKVWNIMYKFSINHDYLSNNEKWDIFNPQSLSNRIMICRNTNYRNISDGIMVSIYIDKLDDKYGEILWQEGYSLRDNNYFDNKHKWKVDYTHDWIINEFLPYILYEEYSINKSFFSRKISFEKFKSYDMMKMYEIESLKKS